MGKSFTVTYDEGKCRDGCIEIRPVLRFKGHFNRDFARLFNLYASDKISALVSDQFCSS